MNEPTLDNVIRSLERLERQNWLLKIVSIAMLIVVTAAACEVVGNPKNETFAEVRAKKFVLIDGNNEQLAILGTQGLTLRGPAANIILKNVEEKDSPQSINIDNPLQRQPYISLQGRNGNITLDIGKSKSKDDPGYGPFLSIHNQSSDNPQFHERDMVELSVSDGNPSLNLSKNSRSIWNAP